MFDNQGGFNLSLTSGVNATTAPGFNGLTGAAPGNSNAPEKRNTPNVHGVGLSSTG